jgi:formylmethanofuran dehydrogenase subunit E
MEEKFIYTLPKGVEEIYSNEYDFERNEEEGTLFYVCENKEEYDEVEEYISTLKRDGERMYDPEDFIVCDDCGDIVENDYATYVSSGEYVCESCLDDYTYCEKCGEYHQNDEIVHIVDIDEYWCDECADAHCYRCEECGDWVRNDYYVTADGRYICESCREENYVYCYGCDELIHLNDAELINDEYYCSSCAEDHQSNDIRNWHNDPDFNPCYAYNEEEKHDFLIGFELETERGDIDECVEVVQRYGGDEETLYMAKDGSLDCTGVEIISQPMSKMFFDAFDFEGLFKDLKDAGRRSHDTDNCGLHIHLNEMFFGGDEEEQELIAGVVVDIMDTFRNKLEQFARRKSAYYYKYPSDENYDTTDKENLQELELSRNDSAQYKEKAKKIGKDNYDRYRCLNRMKRNPTYEFRIYKGTLNPETFRASVEMSIRLVEYAKYKTVKGEHKYNWEDFMSFAPSSEVFVKTIERLVKK